MLRLHTPTFIKGVQAHDESLMLSAFDKMSSHQLNLLMACDLLCYCAMFGYTHAAKRLIESGDYTSDFIMECHDIAIKSNHYDTAAVMQDWLQAV